jgi:hypothetical protein
MRECHLEHSNRKETLLNTTMLQLETVSIYFIVQKVFF